MISESTSGDDRLGHVPLEIRQRIEQELPLDDVQAVSGYDLNKRGQYTRGYVLLTVDRLGHLSNGSGDWRMDWIDVEGLADAHLVEGLGMSLLRLVRDGQVLDEYRYTNRHAKSMADLHRRLEQRLGHEEKQEDKAASDEHGPPKDVRLKVCPKCESAIPDWAESCPRCLQHRKVLMRLAEFVKPHKWRMLLGFALALAVLGMDLFQPWLTKWMIDLGIQGQQMGVFFTLVAVFGVTISLIAVAGAIQNRIMAGLGMRVAAEIRDKAYSHLHKLSLAYYSRKSTGSLITRVTSDSDRIWDFIAFNLLRVVTALLTFGGVGIMMLLINWRLALLALIPLPAMIFMMTFFHRRMHKMFRRMWHRWSAMTAVVADAIPGMRVIKAFGQEPREISRFHDRNYRVYDAEKEMINTWTLFGPVMMMASHIGFIIIWLVGGYWAMKDFAEVQRYNQMGAPVPGNLMTIGSLTAFVGLMWRFFQPIHMVAHMSRMFNRAATSAQRILEVLDTQPEIYTKTGAKRIKRLEGPIEFCNVSFSYDGVRRVLKDVSFTIEPGEMVGLCGQSGSGKTTLVNLLCRFYDVTDGQILIDGTDIRDYNLEDLRELVGVVLQEPYLFRGTIAENVAYGNSDADIHQIIRATKAANVHDAIVGFPDGYDTMVGERGHTLSGGERQRVSIARAILDDPQLLILDEATSNVDTETEQEIQLALDRLVQQRTTIAIAHRLSTLRKADRLIVLHKGEMVEMGSHAELENKEGGEYARLLNMQKEMRSYVALNG